MAGTRAGFTVIEMLLVLAVLIIAAACVLPWLVDRRYTAQEAAAAAALKSRILPAQVQFQAGQYLDQDGNGVGEYATWIGLGAGHTFPFMSGWTPRGIGMPLNLLPPDFNAPNPCVGGYCFNDPVSVVSCDERVWAVLAQPVDAWHGRRVLAINQFGIVRTGVIDADAWRSTAQATDPAWFGPRLGDTATGAAPAGAGLAQLRQLSR